MPQLLPKRVAFSARRKWLSNLCPPAEATTQFRNVRVRTLPLARTPRGRRRVAALAKMADVDWARSAARRSAWLLPATKSSRRSEAVAVANEHTRSGWGKSWYGVVIVSDYYGVV